MLPAHPFHGVYSCPTLMHPPRNADLQPTAPPSDKLDSWKEIAAYLGKGVTTVRRWEREEGLPVRRQEHAKRGSIFALKPELDAWLNARTTMPPDASARPRGGWSRIAGMAAATLTLMAAGLGWMRQDGWSPDVKVHMLTAYPGGEAAQTFAPGGERFAYVSNASVYVKDVGVEPARELYRMDQARISGLSWSPDGRQIAFSYTKAEPHWELALIDTSGHLLRQLGDGGPTLSWRPDSQALIYAHRPIPEGPWAIFERELASGGRARQVSFPPPNTWGDILGVLDPTGQHLAVARYGHFGQGDVHVSLIGERPAVRRTFLQNWVVGIDWLPEGRGIVFGGNVEGREGIYRVAEKGSGAPQLIAGTEGINRYPQAVALEPGAIRIAFVSEPWNLDLTWFDSATGRKTPVARSTQEEALPDISADGQLVFSSARTGSRQLWVCLPGCAEPRQITNFSERQTEITSRWSPDGRRVAFVATVGGRPSLMVANSDGSHARVLSTGTGEGAPSWSADGLLVYFSSDRSGRLEIWRIPAAGGAAKQITRQGGEEAFESADGTELLLIRANDNATVWRHSLANGTESPVMGMAHVSRRTWRPVGRGILHWTEHLKNRPPSLLRFDLDTTQSQEVVSGNPGTPVRSFSANANGQMVWSDQKTREDDLKAVDLTFRPFWKLF